MPYIGRIRAEARDKKTNLSRQLAGKLGPGIFEVHLQEVKPAVDHVDFIFQDERGRRHSQRVWPADKSNPDRMSGPFFSLLRAMRYEPKQAWAQLRAGQFGPTMRELLGRKLRITLRHGAGYRTEVDGGQIRLSYGDLVQVFGSVEAAREYARRQGWKPSFLRVGRYDNI